MKQQELVLLYNLQPDTRLREVEDLLRRLRFAFRLVPVTDTEQTLGYLLNLPSFPRISDQPSRILPDEMMVLSGLSDRRLSALLGAFRTEKIPGIALKAVVTDTNIHWSLRQLHFHLQLERSQMQQAMRRAQSMPKNPNEKGES